MWIHASEQGFIPLDKKKVLQDRKVAFKHSLRRFYLSESHKKQAGYW